MNQSTKWIVSVIVVVAVVAIGYFVSKGPSGPVSTEPIKIGATLALTGNLAYIGEAERNGLNLATDEINSKGGINGRPIKLVIEDNQGDAKNAVTDITKLLNIDNVDIVFSAFTHITNAIKKLVAEKEKIMIYASTVRDIARENELFFRDYFDAEDSGKLIAYLISQRGYKSVNFLTEVGDSCLSYENSFNDEAQKMGIKVVTRESYDPKTTDLRTQLAKIKSSKADALMVCAWRHEHILMPQLKALGMINTAVFHAVAPFLPAADTQEMRDLFSENKAVSTWYGTTKSEKGIQFTKKYFDKYNLSPRPDSFYAFDDVYVIADAIKNCLSDKSTVINSRCVADELLKTNYDGVSGKLSFDKDGLSVRDVTIIAAKDGKWEEISVK